MRYSRVCDVDCCAHRILSLHLEHLTWVNNECIEAIAHGAKTDRKRERQQVKLVQRDDLEVCPLRRFDLGSKWLVFRRIFALKNGFRVGDKRLSYIALAADRTNKPKLLWYSAK